MHAASYFFGGGYEPTVYTVCLSSINWESYSIAGESSGAMWTKSKWTTNFDHVGLEPKPYYNTLLLYNTLHICIGPYRSISVHLGKKIPLFHYIWHLGVTTVVSHDGHPWRAEAFGVPGCRRGFVAETAGKRHLVAPGPLRRSKTSIRRVSPTTWTWTGKNGEGSRSILLAYFFAFLHPKHGIYIYISDEFRWCHIFDEALHLLMRSTLAQWLGWINGEIYHDLPVAAVPTKRVVWRSLKWHVIHVTGWWWLVAMNLAFSH